MTPMISTPPPPQPKKPSPFASKPLMAVYGAVGGLLVGALAFGGGTASTASPAPAVTVTSTVTAPAPAPTESASDSDDTSSDSTATYTPKKSDWAVGVKVTSKQCFGTAGCNVTVKIDPIFLGETDPPEEGTVEVTYKLTGTSDPLVDSFTVHGGSISYTKSQDVETDSASAKIAAKVTDVSYDAG